MKILITNIWLDKFCGTESWCYAIANELKRRGHIVDIYTRAPGVFMKEFEKSGFKFVSSGQYDLILDNHCIVNDKKFSGIIIHTCHGIVDLEKPLKNAINVAVSEKVSKYWNLNIIIPNGIDTNRFYCKKHVNKEIKKILSLCKSNTANNVLKKICSDMNIEFESLFGKEVFNVEDKINEADLVIGVGRSLLDAMACGRPVISFDDRNYYKIRNMGHGYITADKFKYQQIDNFTGSSINKSFNSKFELAKEIFEKYNPDDGEVNRQYILDNLSIEKTVDKYLALYNKIKEGI